MTTSLRWLFVFCLSITILLLTAFYENFPQKLFTTHFKASSNSSIINVANAQNILLDSSPFSADTKTISRKEIFPTEDVKANEQCSEKSPLLRGNLGVFFTENQNYSGHWPPTFEELSLENPVLEQGGYNPGPKSCKARNSIAVIVPYRDREEHLRYFLHYIHLILQRQQTRYVIYVVEQHDDNTFNRGLLMNAGFLYAIKNSTLNISCFFFHDVDIVSEDDRTLYRCRDGSEVTHLAGRLDKFQYKLRRVLTVGGILGLTKKQFVDVNGFSNAYYGWGGEDDDMNRRLKEIGKLTVYRPPEEYKRFKMIHHKRDKKNPTNPKRRELLNKWRSRQPHDGINSLDSPISKVIKYPTHTRLYVKVKSQ